MGLLGGLLSGVGKLIGGAAGNSSPDPRYQRVGLDNAGTAASQGLLKRSQETPEQFAQRNLAGVETDPTRVNQQRGEGMARNMSALGMSNATEQAQAINNKIGQKYASQLAEVGRDARLKGIGQSLEAKAAQGKAQTAQDQVNQQQELIERQAFEEAEANRNAVFSQVISGLGGFAVKAGSNVTDFMGQMNTPKGKMDATQLASEQKINQSPLGGSLKSFFGGGG